MAVRLKGYFCCLSGVRGSLGDACDLVAGEEIGCLAGLPRFSVDGECGVLGAGEVKTLESSRVGVPTVKSSSKEPLLDD